MEQLPRDVTVILPAGARRKEQKVESRILFSHGYDERNKIFSSSWTSITRYTSALFEEEEEEEKEEELSLYHS
jgi:hypothetical protein